MPPVALALTYALLERVQLRPYTWTAMYLFAVLRTHQAWYVTIAVGVEAVCACSELPYSTHGIVLVLANALVALHVTYPNSKPIPFM